MVTVVDPLGTPMPIFNRSGTTIVEVAGSGVTFMSATSIIASSWYTVVLVSVSEGNEAIKLPEDADIGDLVEVHEVSGLGTAKVYGSSDALSGIPRDNVAVRATQVGGGGGAVLFRKVSSTRWLPIGPAAITT